MTEPTPTDPAPAPVSAVLCSAWANPPDVPEPHRAEQSDAEWVLWLTAASEILWAASGRQWFGAGCTETAVFRGACACCGQSVEHPGGGTTWRIPARGEIWRSGHRVIKLPRDHITAVTALTVDGEPFTGYVVDENAGMIERADGCAWDVCGGIVTVTYSHGTPPPLGGKLAAVELAIQLYLGQTGSGQCQLPQRVQSITREGITMTMLDPMDFLESGRTGITSVDMWIASVNPKHRAMRGMVLTPDIAVARR